MLLFITWFHNYVINIYFNLFVNHIMKQSCHTSLIGSTSIYQAKRHHFITERSPRSDEGRLFSIFRWHSYLVIARETIHKGEHFGLSSTVNKHINMRQWEVIFWTGFIQISVINTHSNFPIFLWYWYDVGNPLRIFSCHEETRINLLLHLSLDLKSHVWTRPSQFLFDRRTFRSCRYPMFHNLGI